MNKLRKYLEITFFIAILIVFSSNSLALFCIMGISGFFSLLLGANPVYENDSIFVFCCLILGLIFLILRIIIFPILYSFKGLLPSIHKFLDFAFQNKKNFVIGLGILVLLLLLDCLVTFFIFKEHNIGYYFVETFGLGLLPSYLVMLIYLKLCKKKMVAKENENVQ